MSSFPYTSQSTAISDKNLNGGLNTNSGPLNLNNTESSDLQNIDFDQDGSILSRNGYTTLNSVALNGGADCEHLTWFEYDASGTTTRVLMNITGDKLYRMDDLDGKWDNVTAPITITAAKVADSAQFLNEIYFTNGHDVPFEWNSSGTAAAVSDVPANLTKAKYVAEFNNYLFYGNVTVSGTAYTSRIYWSNIKDTSTWSATAFIDIAKSDGQEITRLKVLGDKLIVYKTRSIYAVSFTGDVDVPFILPGGGKTNSAVGCVAPFSVQQVNNGHVFLSADGVYFFDGNNSFKVSDKITPTLIDDMNTTNFAEARSLVQTSKNRYMVSLIASGSSENDRVLVWDYVNNAWSLYVGLDIAYMTTVLASGSQERIYFGDYAGFTYRADTGANDNPEGTETAIDAYYWTNWKHYEDLISHKGIPEATIYHRLDNTTLTFAYAYDFEESDQYSQSIVLSTSADVFGVGVFGVAKFAGSGGAVKRRSLTGRGRVVRFKFQNNTVDEQFRIDGFGTFANLETNVG